jgi:hypothetical protein
LVVLVVVFVVVVIADFVMYFNSHFMNYICSVSVIDPLAVDAAYKMNNWIITIIIIIIIVVVFQRGINLFCHDVGDW